MKITLTMIEDWINNDERLYLWWKGSRKSMKNFIKENLSELKQYIQTTVKKTA